LPLTSRDARAFVRLFFSGAMECTLDKQGRVIVPQNLREYSVLDKDVVIIGFRIPDEFIVGYGIDYAEKYRNLPYIATLKKEVYNKSK